MITFELSARRENEACPAKQVFCENCGSYQPMIEHEPQLDDPNPYPWFDITCGTCSSVICTVRIVPDFEGEPAKLSGECTPSQQNRP